MLWGAFILLLASILRLSISSTPDIPCLWNSKTGSTFDLRKLILPSNAQSTYTIKDGDIPCTPEVEPTYSYIWNFCSLIPSSQVPSMCSTKNKTGVVLQYLLRTDGYKECHVIGKYDAAKDDSSFSLLDSSDPSKGVSLTYAQGDRCEVNSLTNYRKATLDVECANTKMQILSAQEPSTCDYHLVMKSYYGCPAECPVTSKGLCDGHGYCKYDKLLKQSYCYCNSGHYGSSCSSTSASANSAMAGGTSSYDGHSVQMGLLITLLILTIGLLGVVGYMVFRITEFRKQQVDEYASLSSSGAEMVETVNF